MAKEQISIVLEKIKSLRSKLKKESSTKKSDFDKKILLEIIETLEKTLEFLKKY